MQPVLQKLQNYRSLERKQVQHLEFLNFQKNDIENARIVPGEDVELEEKRLRLKHGEQLSTTVNSAVQDLYMAEGAVFERVSGIKRQLDKAMELDPQLKGPAEEITDVLFRIEDLSQALRAYAETVLTDSGQLEEVEARIDFLNKLKRKYGGTNGTLDEVLALYDSICGELREVENLSSAIGDLENRLVELHAELAACAGELSRERKKAALKLASKVEEELAGLGMKKTRFEVQVLPVPADAHTPEWLKAGDAAIGETGMDRAVFMIAPNVGEELKPLSKIASGGELSRVVLALKAILAGVDSVETIVFDEVDAGIGGGVAEKVGEKIKALSVHHQVICITHLPQIAKFGDHHYKIEKNVSQGRTRTRISPLSGDRRVEEMARMLGGATITEKTMEHAREMLET
jgi:DNA repair protein RecN (Recombination protein N)